MDMDMDVDERAAGACEKRARDGKASRSFSDGRGGLPSWVPRDGVVLGPKPVVVVVLGAEETAVEPLRVRERMRKALALALPLALFSARGFQETGGEALLPVWRSHCATRPVRDGVMFGAGNEGSFSERVVDEGWDGDVSIDDGELSVGRGGSGLSCRGVLGGVLGGTAMDEVISLRWHWGIDP
jgi:hypothetical protein